jgi:hypothetical protein
MLQKRLHAWVGLWSCEPVGALRVAAPLRPDGATGTTAQLHCGPASIDPLVSPVGRYSSSESARAEANRKEISGEAEYLASVAAGEGRQLVLRS